MFFNYFPNYAYISPRWEMFEYETLITTPFQFEAFSIEFINITSITSYIWYQEIKDNNEI